MTDDRHAICMSRAWGWAWALWAAREYAAYPVTCESGLITDVVRGWTEERAGKHPVRLSFDKNHGFFEYADTVPGTPEVLLVATFQMGGDEGPILAGVKYKDAATGAVLDESKTWGDMRRLIRCGPRQLEKLRDLAEEDPDDD